MQNHHFRSHSVFCSFLFALIVSFTVLSAPPHGLGQQSVGEAPPVRLSGELKKWHKISLTFEGPSTSEKANPNPFTDYRLEVTFTGPDGSLFVVPGYYAADGKAAHSGAESGNKWRAHFAPNQIGKWIWKAQFREGKHVAIDVSVPGRSTHFDEATGSFSVAASDKTGRDFRGKGRLQYTGGRYLQFAETGEYFLKQGADAPENLLAYEDFDGDFKSDGVADNRIKSWAPHARDWRKGDPSWSDGRGKELIGALNYLASEGMNAFSFLTLNIGGDDKNVFPYIHRGERLRLDVSRLDQWEIVFEHATRLGLFLHFKTQETENEMLLDNGDTGVQRRLYYRELIARFGHHLALNWNLGEENGALGKVNQSTEQRRQMARYFFETDPYHHHIVIHNGRAPDDLLGEASKLTGYSLQTNSPDFKNVHRRVREWVDKSARSGRPWAVACDEPGDASASLRPDSDPGSSHDDGRKNGIWGTFLAGGWGNEWYFGYKYPHSDLTCEDFRSRDRWWDYCRIALQFFGQNAIPYWEMENANSLIGGGDGYGFAKPGSVYLVYLKDGGRSVLNLEGATGEFAVRWYDPRSGGALQMGGEEAVHGGTEVSLGDPPSSPEEDWLAVIRKVR